MRVGVPVLPPVFPGFPLPVPTRVRDSGRRAQLSGKWPLRRVAPPTAAVRSPRDRTGQAAAAGQAPRALGLGGCGLRGRGSPRDFSFYIIF